MESINNCAVVKAIIYWQSESKTYINERGSKETQFCSNIEDIVMLFTYSK